MPWVNCDNSGWAISSSASATVNLLPRGMSVICGGSCAVLVACGSSTAGVPERLDRRGGVMSSGTLSVGLWSKDHGYAGQVCFAHIYPSFLGSHGYYGYRYCKVSAAVSVGCARRSVVVSCCKNVKLGV